MQIFDPRQVSVVINGQAFSDWADGKDVISFSFTADAGKPTVGADGKAVFVNNPDRTAKLVLKIKQHSNDNKVLSDWYNLQRSNIKQAEAMNLSIRDLLNADMVTATGGRFTVAPKYVRGSDLNAQEWTIWFEQGEMKLEAGLGD